MTEKAAQSDIVPVNSHWKGENGVLSEGKYICNNVALPIQEECCTHLVARIRVVYNLEGSYG